MPFSVDQFKRLDRSIKPINFIVDGKYDKYGQEFEFGDEFTGLFGFRAVQLNPERTIKFKVADYKRGVRDSGSLFTRETLRGGPVEPRDIVEAYINTNRALFNVKKNFMKDLDAAKTLGISRRAYNKNVDISVAERSAIERGRFRPYYPSLNIKRAFRENATKIGESNPLILAGPAIDSIRRQLFGLSLDSPEFPRITNPLMPSIMDQRTLPSIGPETLNAPGINTNTVNAAGQTNTLSGLTTQQKIDILFG